MNTRQREDALHGIEKRYGISLPVDFRTHLLELQIDRGGRTLGGVDWWPIDQLKNIPEEYEHPVRDPQIAACARYYLFFADYMIWSCAWAICCDDSEDRGKVAVISGADRIVANSFSQFRERSQRDIHSVF